MKEEVESIKIEVERIPRIRYLDITARNLVATGFMGEYPSVFKGKGIEFADYRAYVPGEDASRIDWTASLRANTLLVREYGEERTLNIMFLLDTSSTMVFGSHDKLKHDYAAELVASLSAGALEKGDCVGLAMFNDEIVYYTPPGIGMRQYHLILRGLVDPRFYGGECGFANALAKASAWLEPHSIILIISDFIGFKEDWVDCFKTAAKKHELIAFVVRDPRDNALPAGVNEVNLKDPFSEKQLLVDVEKIKDAFERETTREREFLKKVFRKNLVDFVELDASKSFVEPVTIFFAQRRRKWR